MHWIALSSHLNRINASSSSTVIASQELLTRPEFCSQHSSPFFKTAVSINLHLSLNSINCTLKMILPEKELNGFLKIKNSKSTCTSVKKRNKYIYYPYILCLYKGYKHSSHLQQKIVLMKANFWINKQIMMFHNCFKFLFDCFTMPVNSPKPCKNFKFRWYIH